MAFSKAKILRFNDITSCAPPPGSYNPKFDNHVTGSIVYTKDNKPIQPESPATSISDTKSVQSCASGRNFRTPTVPRRKRTSLPGSSNQKIANLKTKLFSPIKSEALRERIVECANKDETIKDLESQIEELKFAISALKVDKSELTKERDELIIKLKDVEDKLENLSLLLENISENDQKIKSEISEEVKQLEDNLKLMQERLKNILEENENILKETEKKLLNEETKYCNINIEISQLRSEYDQLKKEYEESLTKNIDLQQNHELEIKSFTYTHELEIEELEKNISNVVKQWQETVKKIEEDHLNQINKIKDEHNNDFNKLKECFSSEKQELEQNAETYKSEISKLMLELEEARKKINIEIETRELNMKKSSEEQHRYEITLNKTYETVDALKKRLLNSDRDVEQLNKEIEQLEFTKLQIESKYSETIEQLQEIIKERDALKIDNETLVQIHEKVVILENGFLKKIDVLKSTADLEIEKLSAELANVNKQCTNTKIELHTYILEQQKLNSDADALISNFRIEYECLENENSNHVQKITMLEDSLENKNQTINTQEEIISEQNAQIQELKDKLKEREYEMNEIASVYKKFIDRSKEYDDLQRKHEDLLLKCSALEKTIADQNSLIGPFREQLENYERECQLLLIHKFEAEKEAKEIGLKYAQILGHQNQKQKIKHIVDLKKKNYELMENKNECEAKLLQQKRMIDKLKLKVAQLTKLPKSLPTQELDKENIPSPARMHNSPLKERN